MHPPEREINFGCSFGSVIPGSKLYPVAKYTRSKLWVPGQMLPYLLGMRQIYIPLGATFLWLAYSERRTFWKQIIMTVALYWFLTVPSVAFSEWGTIHTPTPATFSPSPSIYQNKRTIGPLAHMNWFRRMHFFSIQKPKGQHLNLP